MSDDDLPSGRYMIFSGAISAPPPYPIGADLDSEPVKPVIVKGSSYVWNLTKQENGNYTMSLDDKHGTPWLSNDMQGNVVVERMPIETVWVIKEHPDPEFHGDYTIALPSTTWPTLAWTVYSSMPGTEVKLEPYDKTPSQQQLWRFACIHR